MQRIGHIVFIIASLFLCLGVPFHHFYGLGTLFGDSADAVSSASLDIPDQPSGVFYVLLNTEKHPLTVDAWTDFFTEKPVDVIMEDISVLLIRGDEPVYQLADRYLARLAENQMRGAEEDGTLVVSRAEEGVFDVIMFSGDAEPVYDFSKAFEREGTAVIRVEGGLS